MNRSFLERLAVCSWSLQPTDPDQLFKQIQDIGISNLQIALDPLREKPEVWSNFGARAQRAGVRLVSGMFGTVGEDYTTMESIRRTGGIVPDATWSQNWKDIQRTAELAAELGLRLVTFHAGFLPHEAADPAYAKLADRMRQVSNAFAHRGVDLALETGQETAETLADFLKHLGCSNLGVNFDPANMILYDKGDPIEALAILTPWLKQCHIKDARRTAVPGTWGDEVVAGTGEVRWRDFFELLEHGGFRGYCSIEREAGNQRLQDIKSARRMVESLLA